MDTGVAVGRCKIYEQLLEDRAPAAGWDTLKMSKIMWRESRCQAWVRSKTSDTGLLQINDVNHPWLSDRLGVAVTIEWLKDPTNNVTAAAALCDYWDSRRTTDCYQPWAATR